MNQRELEILSTEIELAIIELLAPLPHSERRNVACRIAHRFGWEVSDNDLYTAARELGIDLTNI